MKNLLFTLFLLVPIFGFSASVQVTFTNQADLDAYNFIPNQAYWVHLINDTTLPVSDQIYDLQAVVTIDTILLELKNTLVTDIGLLSSTVSLSLVMEGNKNFDTLFIPSNITGLSLYCMQTYLEYIYGAEEVEVGGEFYFYDNDLLKSVSLNLLKMQNLNVTGIVKLSVQQNDSLKTFYWNNPHHQLNTISFFENRELKHVHIETTMDKVYDGPLTGSGGFNFNPELDSITGFK